jgi:hypothetical protein
VEGNAIMRSGFGKVDDLYRIASKSSNKINLLKYKRLFFADYEKRPYFHDFKLLELNTNSSILAGKPAYTIIGTYELHSFGLQKLMEVGTIIGVL